MSVLKYKDPETGEFKVSRSVKVVEMGGGTSAQAEQLKASGYPAYVTPEVVDVVKRVNAVRQDSSIVFLAMSDTHYPADQTATTAYADNKASSVQANQAAKTMSYLIQPDFFAHLGDVAAGAATTTPDMLKKQIEGFLSLFREAKSDLPVFLAIGNHDAQADGNIHTMSGEYLYKNFTAHSASENTVIAGVENGGYCYRDFADKKLRVFLLNTSEKLVAAQADQTTYGAQRVWLANALLDLNTKADAVDWGFIILSHYPADYGNTMPLSELLKAYVEGTSFTITDPVSDYYVGDETNEAVDFTGKNGAKFISQFHGHIHNFLVDKLYSYASGSGVQYDARRVSIPNGQFNRENYYTTVGSYTDIDFSEDTSYHKTADTADGTSFVVNVINPDEQKIYSFCYGAGYDRTIGYGSVVYYSIASKLTRVTSDNDALSIEAGKVYSATLTPDEGCEFKSVTVTMGGKDITATAYKNGTITISAVTGNVVITAKAQQRPNFTNLVPLSLNKDGTDYYVDGDGYANNTCITTAEGKMGQTETRKGVATSGFMAVTPGKKTIRVAGEGLSIDQSNTRIVGYDADFNYSAFARYSMMNTQHSSGSYYHGKLIDEANTLFTLELEKVSNLANCAYLRVCVNGDGADLIVTVDEEISYG